MKICECCGAIVEKLKEVKRLGKLSGKKLIQKICFKCFREEEGLDIGN